jgi:poly-gamma-glutamate synthesis protein (capsule biosynthesis protein)
MEEREIAYAGLGRNMAAALEPAYIDTPAGRIALIAACSTITEGSIAGEQRRDMQGRPGIAPLRHEARYTVPEDTYDQIQTLSESLDLEVLKEERENSSFPFSYPADGEDYFELPNVDGSNMRFQQGEKFQIDRVADEEDVQALKDQIHRARREADWVITSLHSHEFSDLVDKQKCASFVKSYARTSIDTGADAFIGHGAHALQGIEIYNGAPIFYDLGNFVFQNQLVSRLPSDLYDRYDVDPNGNPTDIFDTRIYDENGDAKGFLANDIEWVSILPICKFKNESLAEIRLYPLDLLQDEPRPRRGRPMLATDTKADEIIDQIAEISAPYGTEIVNEDGVGRVKL